MPLTRPRKRPVLLQLRRFISRISVMGLWTAGSWMWIIMIHCPSYSLWSNFHHLQTLCPTLAGLGLKLFRPRNLKNKFKRETPVELPGLLQQQFESLFSHCLMFSPRPFHSITTIIIWKFEYMQKEISRTTLFDFFINYVKIGSVLCEFWHLSQKEKSLQL